MQWTARAGAGEALTYVGVGVVRGGGGRGGGGGGGGGRGRGAPAAALDPAGGAPAPGLLVVELQVFEALRERQLLLDGHAQQGVQGLLLVLGCRQLALHGVQLGDILVTTAGEKGITGISIGFPQI